jgi:thioredoxin 1
MVILTDQNFEQEIKQSKIPFLVDFWAPWCGPCQMVGPVIEELDKEQGGKLKVGKLNVDENPKIAGQYGVMSIPTVIFFKGGEEFTRKIGLDSKEGYLKIISSL